MKHYLPLVFCLASALPAQITLLPRGCSQPLWVTLSPTRAQIGKTWSAAIGSGDVLRVGDYYWVGVGLSDPNTPLLGCRLRVTVIWEYPATPPSYSVWMDIPNDPALVGVSFYCQAFRYKPPIELSDGYKITIEH